MLDDNMLDQAKREYGLKAIETLMKETGKEIGKEDPNIQIPITVYMSVLEKLTNYMKGSSNLGSQNMHRV